MYDHFQVSGSCPDCERLIVAQTPAVCFAESDLQPFLVFWLIRPLFYLNHHCSTELIPGLMLVGKQGAKFKEKEPEWAHAVLSSDPQYKKEVGHLDLLTLVSFVPLLPTRTRLPLQRGNKQELE